MKFLIWVIKFFFKSGTIRIMNSLTKSQLDDLKILARFIELYCRAKHDRKASGEVPVPELLQSGKKRQMTLCRECAGLLEHGMKKRALCPLDPKPACKNCRIHCYTPEYRQKIRTIMAYSGRKMILRGRLDYLWHYYFQK
jgi:hypothetical protein